MNTNTNALREAFELYMKRFYFWDFSLDEDGDYMEERVELMWDAFQVAHNAQQEIIDELRANAIDNHERESGY